MLRRLAAIAACVIFLAAVPTGSLYVTTLPSGADVWIDGTYAGRSPLVLGGLVAGRHTVGLTKTGWDPLQLEVTTLTSQTTLSSTKLERAKTSGRPLPGSIAIHCVPSGSTFIDGFAALLSKDGTFPVAAGLHEVSVRTARGRITRTVRVWPQTRTDVVLQPEVEAVRPSVVAPAEDYLPAGAIHIAGERIVIRYGGHEVIGRLGATSYRVDGKPTDFGEPPTMIGARLYLPLELLTLLSSGSR